MRIAIIGCGQLARMLALAGMPLGIKFSFIADSEHSDTACVEELGTVIHLRAGLSSQHIFEQAGRPDIITVEKEQLDIGLLNELSHYCQVHPSVKAINICGHRLYEKDFLKSLGIPTAAYHHANTPQEIRAGIVKLGLPVVIKSANEGYDGKNQWTIKQEAQLEDMLHADTKGPWLVEKWIPFTQEVSLIGARSNTGKTVFYPPVHNIHKQGILIESIAPAQGLSSGINKALQDYFTTIATELNYVGVLAMECFIYDRQVLINELAPRVHNSGHWTQLGSKSCQFENHIRAISGLSAGSTESLGIAGMLNILNLNKAPRHQLNAQSSLHWYNKAPRPGRKLGHINFLANNINELNTMMASFKAHL